MNLRILTIPLIVAAIAGGSCLSPVEDDEIEALGPEVDGIPEGPFHRYGQNCLACHGGYGGGPLFTIAGTVFATRTDDIPVQGAVITVTDALGVSYAVPSNCAGNFYIEADAYPAAFPLRVEVECNLPENADGERIKRRSVMGTRINRDGGCASCHTRGGATMDSPGQVFCVEEQPDPPFERESNCEGGPR